MTWITPKIESFLPCTFSDKSWKFRQNPSTNFRVILFPNKPTNKPRRKHNLLGRGKHVYKWLIFTKHSDMLGTTSSPDCLSSLLIHETVWVKYFMRGHGGRVVTLASHLWGRGSIPSMASSGKAGSCLPLVSSLQYRTLTNCMYWFPLPFQLPVVIWPVQC